MPASDMTVGMFVGFSCRIAMLVCRIIVLGCRMAVLALFVGLVLIALPTMMIRIIGASAQGECK